MQVFNKNELCPKCGAITLKTEFQSAEFVQRMNQLSFGGVEQNPQERLQLTCLTCTYRFYRAPLDFIKVI